MILVFLVQLLLRNCLVSNSNEVYPIVSTLTEAFEVLEFIFVCDGRKR